MTQVNNEPVMLNGIEIDFSKETFIMGILNVTPDSFSDGAKDGAKAVADGTKKVTKAVANGTKNGAKAVADGTKKVTKAVANGAKDGSRQ